MDERIGKGKKKGYFVKCKGWEALDDHTWEPVDSIGGSKKLIKEYKKRIEEINKKKFSQQSMRTVMVVMVLRYWRKIIQVYCPVQAGR